MNNEDQDNSRQEINRIAGKTHQVNRLLNNMVLVGTIVAVDYASDLLTINLIPEDKKSNTKEFNITAIWLRRRAGWDKEWWAPEIDEQVVLVSPDGDLNRAVVIGSLPYKNSKGGVKNNKKIDFQTPQKFRSFGQKSDTRTMHHLSYADGTTLFYDKKNHRFELGVAKSDKPEQTDDEKYKTRQVAIVADGKNSLLDIKCTKKVQFASGLENINDKNQSNDAGVYIESDGEAGSLLINIKEKMKFTVAKDKAVVEVDKNGNLNITNKGTVIVNTDGSAEVHAGGDIDVSSDGNILAKASKSLTIESGGKIELKAKQIVLDGGKKLTVSAAGVAAS
jgi:phage baseplate assembly protein gpV